MNRTIDTEHPEYRTRKWMWKKYRDLYSGGEQFKRNAEQYLSRRVKEPLEVYAERLDRVFYENHIGSIIDWYSATVFRREPNLTFEGEDDRARKFFAAFAEDCDLRGTTLTAFFRRQLVETLVQGASYILVDFPRIGAPAGSRAEEDARGASRAYLVNYSPENVINWELDELGNYEWLVIRQEGLRKVAPEGGEWASETRWIRYDRETYRVYARKQSATGSSIELMDEGPHALAALRRVPIFEIRVSEGLWLMNKAALLQLEHFNKANALSWALTMGLFAQPVVYSERQWNQIVGESYYIQMGPNDRFGWAEPEGKVYQIAADNLTRLQEEIYRVCYLMQQAGSANSSQGQSGLSKLRDFTVTQEVLRAYGDVLKDAMKVLLKAIAAAREDRLKLDVSGLDDFDINDFASDLSDAQQLLGLGIQSETLRKTVFKRLATKYLCDASQEIKDRIAREIDNQAGA